MHVSNTLIITMFFDSHFEQMQFVLISENLLDSFNNQEIFEKSSLNL